MSTRFQRANFVVSDMSRSLRLYRDVLGFEVATTKGHNPESYSFQVFEIPAGTQIGFCVLSLPDQPRVLALTEVRLPTVAAPRPRRGAIVLNVSDIDAVVDGARALGLHTYSEAKLVSSAGREGREVGIVDFDDNLIVIYKLADAGA